jgi:hypothetical protein
LKVAFDENVPIALVKVFQTFAKEKQFQYLTKGLVIESAIDYAPEKGKKAESDAPWIKRFHNAGGRVIISGDRMMLDNAHERLALQEAQMVVIFFERQWSHWQFFRKCALLLHWWPKIVEKIQRTRTRKFWVIPGNWQEDGKLRPLSGDDSKKLKLEKQLSKKGKPKRKTSAQKPKPAPTSPKKDDSELPLIAFIEAKKNEG